MTPCAELSSGRGTRSATQYRRPAEGRATLCAGRLSSSRRTRRCRGRRRSRAPAPRRPRASAARAGPARVRRRGAMRRATGRPRRRHTRTRRFGRCRRPSRVTYPLGVTARSTPAGPYRGGHGGREVRSVKVTTTVIREPLQDVFFAAADRAMRDAGWRSACDVPHVIAPLEGRYFRQSGGPFVPVAKFDYLGPYDDPKTRKRHAAAFVGVTFPAAERVLSALGAFFCNVTVAEDAGLAARGREFSKRIRSDADVEAAVTEAVGLIEAGAARVADEISDVDALIAPLLDDPDAYGARHKHPAILAAAGRPRSSGSCSGCSHGGSCTGRIAGDRSTDAIVGTRRSAAGRGGARGGRRPPPRRRRVLRRRAPVRARARAGAPPHAVRPAGRPRPPAPVRRPPPRRAPRPPPGPSAAVRRACPRSRPRATRGARPRSRSPRQAACVVVDRLVELARAVLEQFRDRLLLHEPREVLGVLMGLVAGLVDVLLVEVEQARVLGRPLGLVEDVARLGARGRRHLADDLEQPALLALLRPPLRGDDVGHLVTLPFVRSDCAGRRCPRPRARRRPLPTAGGRARGPSPRPRFPTRSPRPGAASGRAPSRRSCRRTCGAYGRSCPRPTARR